MKSRLIRVSAPYGVLQKGTQYPVIKEGRDYLVVKAKGRQVEVPTSLIQTEWEYKQELRALESEEDDELDYYY